MRFLGTNPVETAFDFMAFHIPYIVRKKKSTKTSSKRWAHASVQKAP